MSATRKVEYRVIPIERYVVTRYAETEHTGGSEERGSYSNRETAHEVAYALCRAEHERLGWPIGDERIKYPVHPRDMCAAKSAT